MRFGSITTGIISDGLVFNIDAANRASYVEYSDISYNTVNLTQTQTLYNDTSGSLGSPKGWEFDGVDAYMDSGNLTLLNGAINASWGFWAKINTNANQMPISQWDGSSNFFYFYFNGASKIRIAMNGNSVWSLNSSGLNGLDTWRYYVVTLDGSLSPSTERVKVYVNSTERINSYGESGPTALGTATSNFNIGRREASGGGFYFDGKIPNLHIYNRTLSPTEVLHNYNALKSRFGL